MNHYALRLFVRSLITEAKKEDKDPKKTIKKDAKKPEPKKTKKVNGNLVEMKKELAGLKDKLAKIDDTIKDWESIKSAASSMSYGGEQDIEIGADKQEEILKDCDVTIERLKKEKESIEKEMSSLQENTYSEINKIKEMMGLVAPKKKKSAKKMVDEGIGGKNFTYKDVTGKTKFVTADNLEQAKEKVKKFNSKIDLNTVKEK